MIVRFPSMRRELMTALAALGDREHQQRVWLDRIYPHPGYYDDLTANIHALYDDLDVLPDPSSVVGTILVAGPEIDRLTDLGRVTDQLLHDLADAPDEAYLDDPRWRDVLELASRSLLAVTLAGQFEDS